jgi:hypothetical protein
MPVSAERERLRKETEISRIFDTMANAAEVRAYVHKDPWQMWSEYPRGSGIFDNVVASMVICKFGNELEDDARALYEEWYGKNQ